MMRARQIGWCILLIGLFWGVIAARAQDGWIAAITPPDTIAFPRLTTYLDVHNAEGNFIHGITASQVHLVENGQELPVDEFEELRPGMQLVIAVNMGQSFSIRNSQGISRYEQITATLRDWAASRKGSSIDDLSLLDATGLERTHFNDYQLLAELLAQAYPDSGDITPSLEILARALDIAADSSPRPGMERVILFITSPLQGDVTFGLQTILAQAEQQNVRFFVWYIASPQLFDAPDAERFAALANQSGGHFLAYSGTEVFPALESSFNRFRSIYRLAYLSHIDAGGEHELLVRIDRDGSSMETPPLRFNLDLLPPNPLFLSPFAEIQRSIPAEISNNLLEPVALDELEPDELELKMLVEFPDGRQRLLQRSALYVDGVLVDENTQEPFDRFLWDISTLVDPGQHILRIEVTDTLDLLGKSIDLPVNLTVVLPTPNPMRGLMQNWPVLAGLGVVFVTAIVLLSLILTGRLRPGYAVLRIGRDSSLGKRVAAALRKQNASQTNQEEIKERRLPDWVNHFHWPQQRANPKAFAYLSTIGDGEHRRHTPHSIIADEVTFGRDTSMATLVLDDPSVEALHARLQHHPDGSFVLLDQGSVAGTWLNYTLVPPEGAVLIDGDTIHIGRVAFKFTQREPQVVRKPFVTVQEKGL